MKPLLAPVLEVVILLGVRGPVMSHLGIRSQSYTLEVLSRYLRQFSPRLMHVKPHARRSAMLVIDRFVHVSVHPLEYGDNRRAYHGILCKMKA